MKLADRDLNPQAEALEEAQTEIRLAVRDGWLANRPKSSINTNVQKIIRKAIEQIKLPVLREAAYRSLNAFAERQYNSYVRLFGSSSVLLLAVAILARGEPNMPEFDRVADKVLQYETSARGVPLQEFSQDYFERRIMPAFDKILRQRALDPDDVNGSNSLRNRAEMEVRYNAHLEQIDKLRASGTKLVTCSVHADCSDRCYKWQGRVYSLDGTSGTTDDGKPFVPIEKATDVYYTTKAGKTYKNGLLGFNCRHYLIPYKSGMAIPNVSKAMQQKESAINTRQRELERRVREQKERALIFRNIDREQYLTARRRAIESNKEYIKFSKDNGRAYYPSRTKLL